MPFQIKDFVSIVAGLINHARGVTDKITDFLPGSVARTLMEAPAVEVEELYMQMFLGLRDAIPVATFLSFGFERLPAAVAHGFVSISRTPAPNQDSTVPIGTVFKATDGREYTSTGAVDWPSGVSIVRVPVSFSTAGLSGNIAEGLITSSDAFSDQFVISNGAIETGSDIESDAEREARFAEFIGSLSRGTVAACLYAAKQAAILDVNGNRYEYVIRAGINEQPGHVRIYIYSNRGAASADLVAHGQRIMDGWRDDVTGAVTPGYRAAGVRVDVLAMIERAVTLSIAVEMFPGYELNADVEQRIGDVFGETLRAVEPGATLYLGTLVEALLVVPGVRRIVPSTNNNIICATNETLVPGALNVSTL